VPTPFSYQRSVRQLQPGTREKVNVLSSRAACDAPYTR
jgi:hypothetical protein